MELGNRGKTFYSEKLSLRIGISLFGSIFTKMSDKSTLHSR